MSILQTTCVIFLAAGIIINAVCIHLIQKQMDIQSHRLTDAYIQIRELSKRLDEIKCRKQE